MGAINSRCKGKNPLSFKFCKRNKGKLLKDIKKDLNVSEETKISEKLLKNNQIEVTGTPEIEEIKCEANYTEILQNQCFKNCEISAPSFVQQSNDCNTKKQKRIQNEIKVLAKNLPVTDTNAIFVCQSSKNNDHMQTIITGTKGTPYAYGCFLFDLHCNQNFPVSPPEMKILTTGGGQIRFNPNLYNSGYVCLSIVGTWGNTWNESKSNILQILLSIQSLVMNEDVLFQEPSYNNGKSKKEYQQQNIGYQNIVKYGNIKYAMNEMIEKPPIGFENIIKAHFYLNKHNIIQEIDSWFVYAKQTEKEVQYGGLVGSHNNQIASQLINGFQQKLESEFNRLKKNLENLNFNVIKEISFVKGFLNNFQEKLKNVQDLDNIQDLERRFQLKAFYKIQQQQKNKDNKDNNNSENQDLKNNNINNNQKKKKKKVHKINLKPLKQKK